MATVKVKFKGRLLKLRPSSMTSRNLAMIFKLDSNRGIYLNCEEEGEIILPSDENGMFEIEDVDKTYVVTAHTRSLNSSFVMPAWPSSTIAYGSFVVVPTANIKDIPVPHRIPPFAYSGHVSPQLPQQQQPCIAESLEWVGKNPLH